MTVAELLAYLSNVNPNAVVRLEARYGSFEARTVAHSTNEVYLGLGDRDD